MPIRLGKRTAVLTGTVTIEELEPLLPWLGATPRPTVNLRRCSHLHTAVLQALMASGAGISAAPDDAFLRTWIAPLLTTETEHPHKDPQP